MGCDIHLYIEKKVRGKWVPIKIDERLIPNERNYRLFAFLANVRGQGGHFADRGFPDDTSWKESKGDDDYIDDYLGDHSFTYAYLDELYNAPWRELDDPEDEIRLLDCYFCSFIFQVLPRLLKDSGWLNLEERKDIRILMGFDN